MADRDSSLIFLLTTKKSWILGEKLSPLYSSFISTYSSEGFGKETIKVEECSNVGETESTSLINLSKDAASTFGLIKLIDGRIMYECDYCPKYFKDRSRIARHRLSHTGEKPFQCNLCEKSFASKSEFNVHTRRHAGQKPFQCSVCSKSFVRRGELEAHCRTHNKPLQKSFQCDVCQRLFGYKHTLKRHMLLHVEDKPFKCAICDRTFQFNWDLRDHSLRHTDAKPFKCKCGKSFAYKHTLKNHTLSTCTKSSSYTVYGRKPTGNNPLEGEGVTSGNTPSSTSENGSAGRCVDECSKSKKKVKKQYCCEKCGKAFFRMVRLEKHIRLECYYTALQVLKAQTRK